jgi:hypothetical protein
VNFFTEISPINEYQEHKKDNSLAEIPHLSTEPSFKENSHYEEIHKNPWSISKDSSKTGLFLSDQKAGYSGTSEVYFIICKNCFWCASLLVPKEPYPMCPGCHELNLDIMLIAEDENYRSHQIPTHPVEVEFSE